MNYPKSSKNLNTVTHLVRAAQAVLQYGVGAMVDFPDQTLMTAAPEYWVRRNDNTPNERFAKSRSVPENRENMESGIDRIYDERFAKSLGVDYFGVPTKISYVRFPEWYFCPKCRKFQPINKWLEDYKKKPPKDFENDTDMVRHMICTDPKCKQDLVCTRIVTVCERGHISDFPWVNWVHRHSQKRCEKPSLLYKTGASSTEGLDGFRIECSCCNAWTTLSGAFDTDVFKGFKCDGNHPHKHQKETCDRDLRTVQRGSSSVYFPLTYSSLVIPPYADMTCHKIENSNAFAECEVTLSKLSTKPEKRKEICDMYFSTWVDEIALETGLSNADVEQILNRKWLETDDSKTDVESTSYRAKEYTALNGEAPSTDDNSLDFVRTEMDINDYGEFASWSKVKRVSLIDKLRVVKALVGFSRLQPVANMNDKDRFVEIKEYNTNWYPAYEVRGEGIFIEFEQADIDKWQSKPFIVERKKLMDKIYINSESLILKNHARETITPKFMLLHTLAHLLIKHLSFECGYSVASLSERIYCADEADGESMAGILIYTASGDSEGTLGGLVRQGRPDTLPKIFKKAIRYAQTCSNDPVCIMSQGQGRDSLNLAACHACALLPETCCEERNCFLDRGLVIGTYKDRSGGFYSDLR